MCRKLTALGELYLSNGMRTHGLTKPSDTLAKIGIDKIEKVVCDTLSAPNAARGNVVSMDTPRAQSATACQSCTWSQRC